MNSFPTGLSAVINSLKQREFSSVELVEHALSLAIAQNPSLNAYITITSDLAREQAHRADKLLQQGSAPPLTGVPFCMKDVYLVKGIPTTAASSVLAKYISPYSSTVYKKLDAQHAVLIGKNNQDAWGHGGSSENTDYGPVHNPWDLTRVAGGSGGGTAAAVSSGSAIFGIGEDTGGSIRNPAAYCNLSGLKVTYGRVSRYGAISYASSFDTMGPTAPSAQDLAIILSAIAGHDPQDGSSSRHPVPNYSQSLKESINGKVIGYVPELMFDNVHPELKLALEETLQVYQKLGAKLKKITLPTARYGHAIYYILALSETSSNLARYDGVRYGADRSHFTPESMRRIMTGTYTLSSGYYDAYYRRAQQARAVLIGEFEQAFTQVDALAMPVMPFPPYPIGGIKAEFDSESYAVAMYLADIYTCLANIVGVPALSFPIGQTKGGLPLSMQLHGPMFSEDSLLNLAHQYQQATDWHTRTPGLQPIGEKS